MKRIVLTITLLLAGTAAAGTFEQTPYLPDGRIDVLSRQVTNQALGRDLFSAPHATVVVGNVDVYGNFPYLEARYFQIVSDPGWNRLVYGEVDRGLQAFDGRGSRFGPLKRPRGMATDEQGRVYVADTDNNRVLVFATVTEFDRLTLVPLYEIGDLNQPWDVAFSDGGTPFVAGDDALYVANTGRNEVRRYGLQAQGATLTASLGELGSGGSRFAGPMAVTVARREGVGSADIYVADAHNERLVRLADRDDTLHWVGERRHDLGAVTALASDHWGNIYATSPTRGVVKFTAGLKAVAGTMSGTNHPRSFSIPGVTITDHRDGTRSRAGQGRGILVEQWGTGSGLRVIDLGVEIRNPVLAGGPEAAVTLFLTDDAMVTTELRDPATGAVVATHQAGRQAAGRQQVTLRSSPAAAAWAAGRYELTIRAVSTYEQSRTAETTLTVELARAGDPSLPTRLTLLGNAPNPFNPTTTIRFVVPAGEHGDYSLKVYDTRGRLVRNLADGRIGAGPRQVVWDGRTDAGDPAGSGVYLYRVSLGTEKSTGKMTLLK